MREPKWSRSSPSVIMLEKESDRLRKKRWESLVETGRTNVPLCHLHRYTSSPVPSTYMLHVVTTDIYLHISGCSSVRSILCACILILTIVQVVIRENVVCTNQNNTKLDGQSPKLFQAYNTKTISNRTN